MLTIRKEQMAALSAYMWRSFEDRMVKHLTLAFPEQVKRMTGPDGNDAAVRALIRQGREQAAGYKISSERDVALFIEVMVAMGPQFDQLPQMDWARAILRDDSIAGEDKMWLIHHRLTAQQGPEQTTIP